MNGKTYQPTKESLNTHRAPEWFEDAKFGVFVHWGLYSIPGFAPLGSFEERLRTDYDRAMLLYPYAEGYWNAIKDPHTPSAKFHKARYGDMPYQGFQKMFMENLRAWNPSAWAKAFKNAGAKYVVIVSKHHDGFCLWPTTVKNPYAQDWFSERDILGEFAEAVRREGLRFGIYYSGGIDWTFRSRVSRTLMDYSFSAPGGKYPAYAQAQVRELVARYHPDILWNDIGWPGKQDAVFRLFADYYNAVPDGVVNDRWKPANPFMGWKPVRAMMDIMIKQAIRKNPDFHSMLLPQAIPHSDFATPEYVKYRDIQTGKWEMTRGIGNSFGYNRNETNEDYASFETLLTDFIDVVSKNGNLLLNVGPRGEDARIPDKQLNRLSQFGEWLKENGDAVYGARPWTRAEAVTAAGEAVRFTRKDGRLFVFILGRPSGTAVRIKDVSISGEAHLLAGCSPVRIETAGPDTVLTFERELNNMTAIAVLMRDMPV